MYYNDIYFSKSSIIADNSSLKTILLTLNEKYKKFNNISTNNILSVYRCIDINSANKSVEVSLHPRWPKLTLHLSDGPKDLVYENLIMSFKGYELFEVMSIGDILSTLGCLLTEQFVVMICKDKFKLTRIFLYLLSLLYPFQWENPVIPTLPFGNRLPLFDSPVPIFMGLNEELPIVLYNICI